MLFADRAEAGRLLGERLAGLKDRHPVVLALPRGGVVVGLEVARALGARLGLMLVRKLGAPHHEELAIGAVADGAEPTIILDEQLVGALGVSPRYLDEVEKRALAELARRREVYLSGRAPVPLRGEVAVLVDDGIATGATMLAGLRAARRLGPARLILAVPVAARDVLAKLAAEAEEIVCLDPVDDLYAVGRFYRRFEQLDDAEVLALLDEAEGLTKTEPG